MFRAVRRLHIGRRPSGKPAVPQEIVLAAQNLRHSRGSVAQPLMELDAALSAAESVPQSIFSLIGRTLEQHANYKGELSGEQLQQLFWTAASHNAVKPAMRLYMDVHRHSRIGAAQRIANGREFFRMLRATDHAAEADLQVVALLKDTSAAVNNDVLLSFLQVIGDTASPLNTGTAVVSLIRASQIALPNGPSSEVLIRAVDLLTQWAGPTALNELADHVFYVNPHFRVDDSVAVVFLDAFLQVQGEPTAAQEALPDAASPGGARVLKTLLASLDTSSTPPPLELCELLLMSIVNFQEPPSMGDRVHAQIAQTDSSKYTKETWDVLAQWLVYSDADLQPLLDFVGEMPEVDTKTLELVLLAGERAQRGEKQVSAIVSHFEAAGVVLDASIYEILIRRALRAMEVDRARQLFWDSNTDWNLDNNRHISVLSDLLVALCHTTAVSPQLVLDTYQRVRLFAPRVSHTAQVALLQMLLHTAENRSLTPAGIFLIEQFGETPQLPFETNQEIFYLFYHRILAAQTEDEGWSLFGILNCTIFLPYEAYYPLQLKLCRLGRPDAAHLLFRQLRNRAKANGTRPPGDEMYMMLFHEYALARYDEGIHELETYFRVDLNNEMTVPMMNRMLAAYSALEDSHKVSYLWTEARALPRGGRHGPNDETMCIMLQFFSKSLSLDAVDDLWTAIPSDFRLKLTEGMLQQFVIANCYHGYYSRALDIVKMAPTEYGLPVTAELLKSLYNWTLLPARKEEVREYATSNFPAEWQQLEASGELKNVLLPAEDETGHTDEESRRYAAINELESSNKITV